MPQLLLETQYSETPEHDDRIVNHSRILLTVQVTASIQCFKIVFPKNVILMVFNEILAFFDDFNGFFVILNDLV